MDETRPVEVVWQSGQAAELHLLNDDVEVPWSTDIRLLEEHIEAESNQLVALAFCRAILVGMDDQMVLSFGESDWSKGVGILAK